jgi:gliding motility-associated-like protein
MKRNKKYIIFFLSLFLIPIGIHSQTAVEYNSVSNWIYPSAQKSIGMDFINSTKGALINNGTIWYNRNFTNDGVVNFVNTLAANPALSQFTGTVTQHISGSGVTRFYNLNLASQLNAAAFSLEQNITVAHSVDFNKGVVVAQQTTPETMMNMMKFEDGASFTNVSDNSYVDGFVSKTGNSAFTFPIGNGGFYRPASISAPTDVTDSYAVRYLYTNPDNAGYNRASKVSSISKVSDKEYWVVNRTSGTSNTQLTLSWDVAKTSTALPSNLNNIKIARWDGAKWIDEGNLSTTGNATAGTITANVTGYGVFTVAAFINPPVAVNDTVVTFEDMALNGNVLTNDTIVTGSNVKLNSFSINGTTYQPDAIATLTGVGTITIAANGVYTFTPVLNYSGLIPTISYVIGDTDGNTDNANIFIKVLPLPEVSKTTTKPLMNPDGTFSWKYIIALFNDTPDIITDIQVEDNLDAVFKNKGCTYKVTNISASGNLIANGLYNGSSEIKTLNTGGSLAVNQHDSIQIEVKVDIHGQGALSVFNSAIFNGVHTINNGQVLKQAISVKSDADMSTSTPDSTETLIPLIELTIPDAFSPNGDGINDKFVILRPATVKIELEVFNRWGNPVFKSFNYHDEWDGKGTGSFLGRDLPNGTYYCAYKVINNTTGEIVTKGVQSITLRK